MQPPEAERTFRACDPCHRAKSRCGGDGTNPCPGCLKRGITCTYSPPLKRGPKSGVIRKLQEELDLLRSKLSTGGAGSGSDVDFATTAAAADESSSRSRVRAASAGPTAAGAPPAKRRNMGTAISVVSDVGDYHLDDSDGTGGSVALSHGPGPAPILPFHGPTNVTLQHLLRRRREQQEAQHAAQQDYIVQQQQQQQQVAQAQQALRQYQHHQQQAMAAAAAAAAASASASLYGMPPPPPHAAAPAAPSMRYMSLAMAPLGVPAAASMQQAGRQQPPASLASSAGPSAAGGAAQAGVGSGSGASLPPRPRPVTTLPYPRARPGYIPMQEEPPVASLDLVIRFLRMYFLYSNTVVPLVCKTNLYFTGLRLGLFDVVAGLCETSRPLCDHANGDCSTMIFVQLPKYEEFVAERGGSRSASNEEGEGKRGGGGAVAPSASSGAGRSGGGGVQPVRMPAKDTPGYMKLVHAHFAQVPPHLLLPEANTPSLLSAGKALVYGILAIGARMDLRVDVADEFHRRCKAALASCWDVLSMDTISALLLCSYYEIGCSASGDTHSPKCRIALAYEMVNALENSAAALARRASYNAFSGAPPLARGGSARSGGAVPSPPSSRPPVSTATAAPAPASPADDAGAAAAPAPSVSVKSEEQVKPEAPDATAAASVEAPSGAAPPAPAPSGPSPRLLRASGSTVPTITGVPLDVLLSVQFMAFMTSAYQPSTTLGGISAADALDVVPSPADATWTSPRGRISRLAMFVTLKTRRAVSSPDELRRLAPQLLRALMEADEIVSNTLLGGHTSPLGGHMRFSMQATLHVSRAVVYNACQDTAKAIQSSQAALECMNSELRPLINFTVAAVFVQLIPVVLAAGRPDMVPPVMDIVRENARTWPVGLVLLEKAKRRIQYHHASLGIDIPPALLQSMHTRLAAVSAPLSARDGGAAAEPSSAWPLHVLGGGGADGAGGSNSSANGTALAHDGVFSLTITADEALAVAGEDEASGMRYSVSDSNQDPLHCLASVMDTFGEPINTTRSTHSDEGGDADAGDGDIGEGEDDGQGGGEAPVDAVAASAAITGTVPQAALGRAAGAAGMLATAEGGNGMGGHGAGMPAAGVAAAAGSAGVSSAGSLHDTLASGGSSGGGGVLPFHPSASSMGLNNAGFGLSAASSMAPAVSAPAGAGLSGSLYPGSPTFQSLQAAAAASLYPGLSHAPPPAPMSSLQALAANGSASAPHALSLLSTDPLSLDVSAFPAGTVFTSDGVFPLGMADPVQSHVEAERRERSGVGLSAAAAAAASTAGATSSGYPGAVPGSPLSDDYPRFLPAHMQQQALQGERGQGQGALLGGGLGGGSSSSGLFPHDAAGMLRLPAASPARLQGPGHTGGMGAGHHHHHHPHPYQQNHQQNQHQQQHSYHPQSNAHVLAGLVPPLMQQVPSGPYAAAGPYPQTSRGGAAPGYHQPSAYDSWI